MILLLGKEDRSQDAFRSHSAKPRGLWERVFPSQGYASPSHPGFLTSARFLSQAFHVENICRWYLLCAWQSPAWARPRKDLCINPSLLHLSGLLDLTASFLRSDAPSALYLPLPQKATFSKSVSLVLPPEYRPMAGTWPRILHRSMLI